MAPLHLCPRRPALPKDEWGVKRLCPNCSTRFYDLQNDPMTCPNCGAVHTADSLAAGKSRSTVSDKADPKTAAAVAAEPSDDEDDTAVVLDDDDDDDDDVEDLGDDVLDDDADEDNVSLDDLTEVAKDDDDDG
jgi:uncharacterized protein (TIGR02300 family)